MKRIILGIVFALLTMTSCFATAGDDVAQKPSCSYCGMDREKFGHSRLLIKYEDGTEVGTCSLHCAAIDMAINIDRAPAAIMVGDYGTRRLIDAEKAFWVIGGTKQGVMSTRAKWAFGERKDAEAFVAANSGTIAGFEEAIKAAYEDLYADTKMIRDRRKMKQQKMMEQQKGAK